MIAAPRGDDAGVWRAPREHRLCVIAARGRLSYSDDGMRSLHAVSDINRHAHMVPLSIDPPPDPHLDFSLDDGVTWRRQPMDAPFPGDARIPLRPEVLPAAR